MSLIIHPSEIATARTKQNPISVKSIPFSAS